MTARQGIPLVGCRIDVLGHALKAVGVLRALAQCAAEGKADPDAEGWWDIERACFRINSPKYPTSEQLREFFAKHYEPTPIIAAWNKSGGVTDKVAVTISPRREIVHSFRRDREPELLALGMKKTAKVSKKHELKFNLADPAAQSEAEKLAESASLNISFEQVTTRGVETLKVTFANNPSPVHLFHRQHVDELAEFGFSKRKQVSKDGEIKFALDAARANQVRPLVEAFRPESIGDNVAGEDLANDKTDSATALTNGADSGSESSDNTSSGAPVLQLVIERKETGKKDGVLPQAATLLAESGHFQQSLELARSFAPRLQDTADEAEAVSEVIEEFRDQLDELLAEAFDSLCAVHVTRQNDNPLFVRRGRPGDKVNADIFLNYWEYFLRFKKSPNDYVDASLFGLGLAPLGQNVGDLKGKGFPFFPDAIKSYNQGTEWVSEKFPFCPLDYLLAVEGAIAMRGATSKTLSAHSRSRAAFPFVFDGVDTMTDENGDVIGSDVAASFWYPLWNRPTTYSELVSYILDSQTRLPTKECRFSGDFARAVRSQGTDAGFLAFQEFRFKLKGASVPWTTAGRFVPCTVEPQTTLLNELLTPVDANGFLEQFRFARKAKDDLHKYRLPVLDAIDDATTEPSPDKIVEVLCRLAVLNAHLATSQSLREKISSSGRVRFIPALPSAMWDAALHEFEQDVHAHDPEFEIARALASITGHEQQPNNKVSPVEPFLGSLVPLKQRERGSGWILPMKPEPPSAQAVWSGSDLCFDLAAILARRYLDSSKDARPALWGHRSASLHNVLKFLRGELDDRRIARLVMGLSLVDWQAVCRREDEPSKVSGPSEEDDWQPIPLPYAALRSLIDVGINPRQMVDGLQESSRGPSARSPQAINWLCQRTPDLVAAATSEALRRLAIVGVKNCYGKESREQKKYLGGRDVVSLSRDRSRFCVDPGLAQRLAAAVLIPLNDWRDRWTIFQSVTLPQTPKTKAGDLES